MIPAPLRSQVRDAIGRAWDAAIESGALPPLPDDVDRPRIEVEHPAEASHGDLATNLAMKLARPYRKPPLEIATLLAAKLVRDASAAGSPSPIEAAEVAPPGFLNLRLSAAPSRPPSTDPGRAGLVGSRRAHLGALRERRVRVGQPDRAAHDRERAGRVHRRPAQPRARGRRPDTSRASTTSTTRRPDRQSGRVGRRHPARRARPRGRLSRRLRRGPRGATSPTSLGRRRRSLARMPRRSIGRWAAGAVRAGIEASLERLGVHFDVWTSEGVAARGRLGRSSGRAACASVDTSTSRMARCGSGRPTSATTRIG